MHVRILVGLFVVLSLQFEQVTPDTITYNATIGSQSNASYIDSRSLRNASKKNPANVPTGNK